MSCQQCKHLSIPAKDEPCRDCLEMDEEQRVMDFTNYEPRGTHEQRGDS